MSKIERDKYTNSTTNSRDSDVPRMREIFFFVHNAGEGLNLKSMPLIPVTKSQVKPFGCDGMSHIIREIRQPSSELHVLLRSITNRHLFRETILWTYQIRHKVHDRRCERGRIIFHKVFRRMAQLCSSIKHIIIIHDENSLSSRADSLILVAGKYWEHITQSCGSLIRIAARDWHLSPPLTKGEKKNSIKKNHRTIKYGLI